MRKRVNWVLDADLRGFFETSDHAWLTKFLEHRIADRRVLRLVKEWLWAGAVDDRRWSESDVGTPQGAVVSPLIANVCLHYAFDVWVEARRNEDAAGDMIVVRYANEFVLGFERREDAERFLRSLHARTGKPDLALHPEKTQLIELGRSASGGRDGGGDRERKPETSDFPGFTHRCGRTPKGRFPVDRVTVAKRLRATVSDVKARLRSLQHRPIAEHGAWFADGRTACRSRESCAVNSGLAARRRWRYHPAVSAD